MDAGKRGHAAPTCIKSQCDMHISPTIAALEDVGMRALGRRSVCVVLKMSEGSLQKATPSSAWCYFLFSPVNVIMISYSSNDRTMSLSNFAMSPVFASADSQIPSSNTA